jgi:glycosyltransferase involved in cell wall biosynthesis
MEKNFTSLLDREKFDIIHFQHILGLPLSLIDIAKKCGYPACISLHDFWYICPLTFLVKTDGTVHHYPPDTVDECVKCILKYEGELNYNQVAATHFHLAYRKYYSKHILNKVDIVTCASKYVQRIYKEFYGIYIRLLPLGIVPFTRIEPPSDRPLTFGFFGAVCAVKNILMMVNAFKSVKSDIRLVIWGGGILEYIDEVMKAIADDSRIEYKGLYKPEDLPRVLSSMDISIHPSLNESYSLTIRESLMAGVPVIVSNAEAYKEIIDSTSFYAARFETQIELENIIKKIATDGSTMLLTMKESIPEIRQIKMDVWEWKETYEKLLR